MAADSKLVSHFDEWLLPHMKQHAAVVKSPIGQSLDGVALDALRSFCQDHVFARRWIEECCPDLGDGKLRIGTDCDPLPIQGIEEAYTENEQSQAMLDLKLFCFAYAGDGELFVISMDSGKVYRMVHQWRIEEAPFENWVSEEWRDMPEFLKSVKE